MEVFLFAVGLIVGSLLGYLWAPPEPPLNRDPFEGFESIEEIIGMYRKVEHDHWHACTLGDCRHTKEDECLKTLATHILLLRKKEWH